MSECERMRSVTTLVLSMHICFAQVEKEEEKPEQPEKKQKEEEKPAEEKKEKRASRKAKKEDKEEEEKKEEKKGNCSLTHAPTHARTHSLSPTHQSLTFLPPALPLFFARLACPVLLPCLPAYLPPCARLYLSVTCPLPSCSLCQSCARLPICPLIQSVHVRLLAPASPKKGKRKSSKPKRDHVPASEEKKADKEVSARSLLFLLLCSTKCESVSEVGEGGSRE